MKSICAWCGNDMGEKDGQGVEGVSHGICEECENKLEEAMPIAKDDGERPVDARERPIDDKNLIKGVET